MKLLLAIAFAALLGLGAVHADEFRLMGVSQQDVVAHGGGCRKSSPPGQCCHMDHKTGIVHCH